jgi:Ion transport protein
MGSKVKRSEKKDIRQLSYSLRQQRASTKKANAQIPRAAVKIAQLSQEITDMNTLKIAVKGSIIRDLQALAKKHVEAKKPDIMRKYLTERTKDEKASTVDNFIISFNNENRIKWDTVILIMAIWNCIQIPFDIAFEPPWSLTIEVVNSIIDLMFYIDIGIAFRTSYLTFEGFEITDWRKIAKKYIFHGTFLLDLLSVLPFNTMTPVSGLVRICGIGN